MDRPPTPLPTPAPERPGALSFGRDRWLLWILALLPVVGAFAPRALWAPDEPRYGQVAREMLASGDWLVPHANGQPYAEKPPVYWWGVVALSWPQGRVTATTARLGGALYALGAVLLLAGLVRRWFGDPALAVTAAALFASMVFVAWNAERAALDMPLTFFVLLAVDRGVAWIRTGHLRPALAAGGAWALAILTKGPLGLLLPLLALLPAIVVARRHPVPLGGVRSSTGRARVGCVLGLALMTALCLAWLLPALSAGGEAYAERLLGQIAGRATGAEGHHVRPITYFPLRLPAITLPWSLHLLAGAGVLLTLGRRPASHQLGLAACAGIAIGGLVLLSLVATKRELYLLPLLPFASAAGAYAIHNGVFPRLERLGRVLMIGTPTVLAVVLVCVPLFAARLGLPGADAGIPWADEFPLGLAALVLLAGAWAAWQHRSTPPRAIRITAIGLSLGIVIASIGFLPRLDPIKSYTHAARAAEQAAGDGPVYNAGFGQAANLLWSLRRETSPELSHPEDLGAALPEAGPRAAVVASQRWWDAFRAAHPDALPWIRETWREPQRRLGSGRGLLVLTNR